MSLDLARDLHGACPRCPQPTWHNGSLCPLWGAAEERERLVWCRLAECAKTTARNDGCCSDEHARLVVDRCRQVPGRRGGEGGSAPVLPVFSAAGASPRTAAASRGSSEGDQ